jgi:hypothetical protein
MADYGRRFGRGQENFAALSSIWPTIPLDYIKIRKLTMARIAVGGDAMDTTMFGQLLSTVGWLGNLVCFILILIKMFTNRASGTAILCLALSLCCGVGGLVAFIYGWAVSRQWDIQNLMIVWTVAWILCVMGYLLAPISFEHFPRFPGP